MQRFILSAMLALVFMVAFAGGANAGNTYSYTCTNTAGELQLRLNGTNAWTHTNGGAGTTISPVSGDTVEIDGTTGTKSCLGDIFVNTGGLTFKNHNGTDTSIPADEIDGMFEVAGAHITIDGIALTCSNCSGSTTNTTGLSTFPENGALLLHDGAVALFENGQIDGGKTSGIFMTRSAAISLTSTTIAGNGSSGSSAPLASGIFAEQGSSVRLANPDGTGGVFIGGNGKSGGGCPGYGILLTDASSMDSFGAALGGFGTGNDVNSQNTCGQILLQSGSSALIEGTTVIDTTASLPAVQALAGSSFIMTTNTGPAGTQITAGNNGAVLLGGASSAALNTATVQSSGTTVAAIEAAGSSTLMLAGENIVTANDTGGIAFQIDHSSSLFQVQGQAFGFAFTGPETITGSAFVQVQSSMDVGIGLIEGTLPSVGWSVPAGNCILIQQNSSFRMSGGVQIAGAAPAACTLNGGAVSSTIVFQQESNGFFNLGHGGSDEIDGGGSVSCLFAGMPNAHVTGKANITPAGAQPAIIGGWAQANTATSPGCLGP